MNFRVNLRQAGSIGLLLLVVSGYALAQGTTLRGAGSTFAAPIYTQWFAEYKKETGVSVDYQAVGSGAGINALKNRTVDFGATDAPLTDSDLKQMPFPVVQIPTLGGAVVMTYNLPGVGSGLRLTPEIIADIYMGKIKKWNDPRILAVNFIKNLPDLPIHPVHRSDASGTTYIFTSFLTKAVPEWAKQIGSGKSVSWPVGIGGQGNPGVTANIMRTKGGFGYVELAYAIQNHLSLASVRNAAGNFVTPSVTTTNIAIGQYIAALKKDIRTPTVYAPGVNSYPICGLTYVLIYQHGGSNPGPVTKLFSWAMGEEAQKMGEKLYYAPLPPSLIKLNLAALKTVQGAQVAIGP
jgi:phosphate transport system substrate-binding protein